MASALKLEPPLLLRRSLPGGVQLVLSQTRVVLSQAAQVVLLQMLSTSRLAFSRSVSISSEVMN
jgi:hypothetical protein